MLKKHASINRRISFLFIFTLTILFFISGVFLYMRFSNIMNEMVMNSQKDILYQSKVNIDNLSASINQAAAYMSADRAFTDILNKRTEDPLEVISDINTMNTLLGYYVKVPLSNTLTSYNTYLFLDEDFYITKQLNGLSIQDASIFSCGVYNSENVMKDDWFKKAVQLDGGFSCFYLKGDKDKIYISKLVKNPNIVGDQYKDEVVGVVVIGVYKYQFGKQIEAAKLTENTQMLILDDNNNVIYCKDNDFMYKHNLISYLLPIKQKGMYNTINKATFDREKYFISLSKLNWGWTLVSILPQKDITQRLYSTKVIILINTLLAIVLGIIITPIVVKSIKTPIKRLANIMNGIRDNSSITVNIDSPYDDEMGMLYDNFNSMMHRINNLVEDLHESNVKEKAAELKALQAQINPHFIYNTLDSVNWMLLKKNEDKIANMIYSLTSIMRYSIKDPHEMVSLSEELKHVENYISIQSQRYSNFNVKYSIQPVTNTIKVPKFIIQPLVENAIIHGIQNSPRSALICISASVENENFTVIIKDNGNGADVEVLNAYLAGSKKLELKSDGFGIKNVNDRIKMHFGENYGLHFRRNTEYGISAVLNLPVPFTETSLNKSMNL